MNKTAIKNFAIWARNKLIADISYRAGLMGITVDGIHAALPQSTGQTEFYDIGTAEPYAITGEAIRQRRHLVELIQRKEKDTDYKTAYKYIIEEVAYTWFNRLIAVRFMEVNDYLPSHIRVLSSDTGKLEPDLVTTPFDAELEFTNAEQQTIIDLKNANKLDEVFRLLFIKQCNALNEILPALFENTNDYTELLLNLSVIDQDGVVNHLVHDIQEEDFDVERGGQVEIIGWLYQYYNTEPKNEAFAKKGKITKEEVPAVTQLFTPDWIVRYMVENSLGRLWVEGHPNEDLKAGWKYYLEEAEQEPDVQAKLAEIRSEYAKLNPEDIKIIDPCMGSGHILVYAFDVLMQIYESAGYGQRDAARSILENNLYGLDIDDRAFQMAYFAIMMKARQYNRRILNGEYKPNVYSIQESNGINRNQLKYFGVGLNDFEKNIAITQVTSLLDTFKDAKEYGSILVVDECDWNLLDRFVSHMEMVGQLSFEAVGLDDTAEKIKRLISQGRVLTQKYLVSITNPPYMAISNGSNRLINYVKEKYPSEKADLFAVFVKRCSEFLSKDALQAMITMHGWMFLTTFENMRKDIKDTDILNMAHLGAHAFEEISGEIVQTVAFIMRKSNIDAYRGKYVRLVDCSTSKAKEESFLKGEHQYIQSKSAIEKLPGFVHVYWASNEIIDLFTNPRLGEVYDVKSGLSTGDNDIFLRYWYEVRKENFSGFSNYVNDETAKWVPYNKGGGVCKWYGINYLSVNWGKSGDAIRNAGKAVFRNPSYYFREGITWSGIASSGGTFRYCPNGFVFDSNKGPMIFEKHTPLLYALGLLNSKITQVIIPMLNPTISLQIGDIVSVPVIFDESKCNEIVQIVEECIQFAKEDWDSYEYSWDFGKHPLLRGKKIEDAYMEWKHETVQRFSELHRNEEKLNRLFISIYGLEGIVSPEIKSNNITVHRADLEKDIKSLLLYAVGCIFGRYSLDEERVICGSNTINYDKYSSFRPDQDNIVPITDEEYFEDDIVGLLCKWLKNAYSESTLEENLDFIAKALGTKGNTSREKIRNYFLKDFFKDCSRYFQKAPIYWQFDSGVNNGFKALIYLHRYNADTIGNLRIDYLHRMQRIYESEISRMQDMIDHSTNGREVAQATKRREKLIKQLKECREYDEKLAHLALSRIELDLDDGVKVNYRKLQTANDGKFYEVLADSKNIMAKK